MKSDGNPVLIAGGGPVGLLCAWLLGRCGLPVRLFDNNAEPQADPRAATTHPATLELLAEDGLAADMARVGLVAPIFQFWDRPSGELVAQFDHALLKDDTRYPYVVQCEQFKTARLILDRLRKFPNVEVLYGHEIVDVSPTDRSVAVEVHGPGGVKSHTGSYLIGADGGRSIVRKQCGIAFDGFTWPEQFIVLTTPYDFEAERGYCYRSYFADPGAWCNCFKVSADGPPGLWRTVFPVIPEQSENDIMSDAGVQARMQKFFPSPQPYDIIHRNLYTTHQRVAQTFRRGRVLLAGDAAHVNSPIGGMGLNSGVHDAFNLADKLARILHDEADDEELDRYERQRRHVAVAHTQAQTIRNKRLLEERDPAVRRRNRDELRRQADDPVLARKFLLRTALFESLREADQIA